jgi:hypothetical protein
VGSACSRTQYSAGRLLVVNDHVGLDAVVAHRQQPDPEVGESPPGAQRLGDLAERVAGVEHLGPQHVGREVAVAQPEPLRAGAVGRQLVPHGEGLVGPTPALALVDAAAEGVHHGVQVGTDPQAEERDVVAGVADDGDLGGPVAGGRGQQPAQEPGPADAPGGHHDAPRGGRLGRAGGVDRVGRRHGLKSPRPGRRAQRAGPPFG